MHRALLLLPLGAALTLACTDSPRDRFDPAPYLADLQQLERVTATTYANFEWAIGEGGIDPVGLDREARRRISAATGDEEARRALVAFADSFADGHFQLREAQVGTSSDGAEPSPPGPLTPPREACAALGYEEHDQSIRIDLGAGFRQLTEADDPLPAGWLERPGESRVGLLRIDEFGANRYGEYCPESWETYRLSLAVPCADWACRFRFRLVVVARVLDEIALRIGALRARGVAGLIVDVTGNGGGTDWVDPAARLLTERVLRGNPSSFVRHPHWRGILEEMEADLVRDLELSELSARQRAVLEEARARLREGMAESGRRCDLSAVWTHGAGRLPCSLLVRGTLFTTGLLAEPPAIDTDGLASASVLFKASEYGSRAPAWRGPLALLTDRRTASAAELFVALLRDNEAAVVIGERTAGVGCGYTNGGILTVLAHTGLELRLPDCVRHRRDGGNERAGIVPDLVVDWRREDDPRARGRKLLRRLQGWPGAGARPAGVP